MYPTSDSSDLTPEQLARLDDSLFESNAASYWRARIDALLRAPGAVDYSGDLASEVTDHGLDERMLSMTEPTHAERELQRALDAFALRHHLAESLVRVVHAILIGRKTSDSGLWASLTSNRDDGHALVQALREFEARGQIPANLFMPAADVRSLPAEPPADVVDAVQMHWRWVRRAMELLVSDGLDANVGNNKLKHGFAVRPRDDLRVSFVTEPPNPDGSIPLSAIKSGVSVVDATAIEFLERLPPRHNHAGSWEVTVLNGRPAPLLAEALMLSTVWASVFASAAADHFEGRNNVGPRHPGLVLGPPPEAIVRKAIGYRQALTTSTKSSASRGLTVEMPDGIVGLTQTGPGTSGVIVND